MKLWKKEHCVILSFLSFSSLSLLLLFLFRVIFVSVPQIGGRVHKCGRRLLRAPVGRRRGDGMLFGLQRDPPITGQSLHHLLDRFCRLQKGLGKQQESFLKPAVYAYNYTLALHACAFVTALIRRRRFSRFKVYAVFSIILMVYVGLWARKIIFL